MFYDGLIATISDYVLFASCIFILLGSLYVTFKMNFVQLRFFPFFSNAKRAILRKHPKEGQYTILPHKALFTAMSTTLGIGTIVGPVVAIHWGAWSAIRFSFDCLFRECPDLHGGHSMYSI